VRFISAESLESDPAASKDTILECDCILVPGGFGDRGAEGKMLAIQIARECDIPFLGICYGMQLACIEFARNVAGIDARHQEIHQKGESNFMIHFMNEFVGRDGHVEKRLVDGDKGGTLRLGGYQCNAVPDSKLANIMGSLQFSERHRHRYEFNNEYRSTLEK